MTSLRYSTAVCKRFCSSTLGDLNVPAKTKRDSQKQKPVSHTNPYQIKREWDCVDSLSNFLFKRIVAISEHFIVLDKPAGLSVWGHSLAKFEAMKSVEGNLSSTGPTLSVKDCLPTLGGLIHKAELDNNWDENEYPVAKFQYSTSKPNEDKCTIIPHKLTVVDPIPAAYSGLVVLGRTDAFNQAAQNFYRSAMSAAPLWKFYQRFLIACWKKPSNSSAKNVRFPIASYSLNDHIRVGYRPRQEEISHNKNVRGTILHKYVNHQSLVETCAEASLIELETNSTFRGLPEVYLLYEGCAVVGELLQSSRLLDTGFTPMALPPNKVRLNSELPIGLRRSLGNLTLQNIPTHIHRTSVFLPIPISATKFRSTTPLPAAEISTNAPSLPCIAWSRLFHPDDSKLRRPLYALSCHAPRLPNYFEHSLERLQVDFAYADWLTVKLKSD